MTGDLFAGCNFARKLWHLGYKMGFLSSMPVHPAPNRVISWDPNYENHLQIEIEKIQAINLFTHEIWIHQYSSNTSSFEYPIFQVDRENPPLQDDKFPIASIQPCQMPSRSRSAHNLVPNLRFPEALSDPYWVCVFLITGPTVSRISDLNSFVYLLSKHFSLPYITYYHILLKKCFLVGKVSWSYVSQVLSTKYGSKT